MPKLIDELDHDAFANMYLRALGVATDSEETPLSRLDSPPDMHRVSVLPSCEQCVVARCARWLQPRLAGLGGAVARLARLLRVRLLGPLASLISRCR